jgi:hypothetical protein
MRVHIIAFCADALQAMTHEIIGFCGADSARPAKPNQKKMKKDY